jgi:hypothetical protein
MVEYVEELSIKPQFHTLTNWKPLRNVKIVPEKIGTAQGITGEVAELAILRNVAAVAGSGS